MRRQDEAISIQNRIMPAINRDDAVLWKSRNQTLVKFNDDIASRKGKANAHSPFHGIGKNPVAYFRLTGSANSVNEGVDAMDEIVDYPLR